MKHAGAQVASGAELGDANDFSEEGDWSERKEAEKDATHVHHLYFINFLSAQRGREWKCKQINSR